MWLYKYRSLQSPKHWRYVKDIIQNKRFHAAQYSELGDPMEGLYRYDPFYDHRRTLFGNECLGEEEFRRCIAKSKKECLICSFSRDSGSPPLWVHYADGCKGICIEIEVIKRHIRGCYFRCGSQSWCVVQYKPHLVRVHSEPAGFSNFQIGSRILTHKLDHWCHEKEVRVFAKSMHVCCGKNIRMTKVLLGMKMPSEMRDKIRQITPPGVEVYETKFDYSKSKIVTEPK
jgi:hypothetical protein